MGIVFSMCELSAIKSDRGSVSIAQALQCQFRRREPRLQTSGALSLSCPVLSRGAKVTRLMRFPNDLFGKRS